MHSLPRRRFLTLAGATSLSLVAASRLLRLDATPVRAQALPGASTFRGAAGKSFIGPVALNAGVTVVRCQHNGTGDFIVNTFVPNDGYSPADAFNQAQTTDNSLVYDVIGSYKGGSVVLAGYTANYYVYVDGSGAWQVSVEQPLPETVSPVQQTTFAGTGQDVTPYFVLPDGISQIAFQAPAGSGLAAYLYHLDDLGGAAIVAGQMGYQGRIFDLNDPNNAPSYPISLPDNGPYVFFVTNDIYDTTRWTVSFS